MVDKKVNAEKAKKHKTKKGRIHVIGRLKKYGGDNPNKDKGKTVEIESKVILHPDSDGKLGVFGTGSGVERKGRVELLDGTHSDFYKKIRKGLGLKYDAELNGLEFKSVEGKEDAPWVSWLEFCGPLKFQPELEK